VIKVLHIGKFFPPPYGGMESVLADLVDQLTGSVQVDVLVANDRPQSAFCEHARARVWKAPSLGRLAGASLCPTMPRMLKRLIRRYDYDLIHLHLPNPTGHLALKVCRSGIPLVITWHSDIIRQRRLLRLYQPFVDRLVGQAAAVIAATPKHFTSSRQLAACDDAERRRVVPFGIDSARFHLTPESRSHAEDIRDRLGDRKLVFAVGRHVEYKGFEYLIRAMAELRGAHLILGGAGPLTPSLQRLSQRLGLSNRVEFAGTIPPAALPAYYHAADVFCMPSVGLNEAFGIVQLEAMACGKPVVCCELHNGVTWVNQHGVTGLVVPPRDPSALAAALGRLLNDVWLRQSLGHAAFERVTREFSLTRMREGTLEVYHTVLGVSQPVVSPALARAA
jgi:rhamnosyl/mannosyltransferase